MDQPQMGYIGGVYDKVKLVIQDVEDIRRQLQTDDMVDDDTAEVAAQQAAEDAYDNLRDLLNIVQQMHLRPDTDAHDEYPAPRS